MSSSPKRADAVALMRQIRAEMAALGWEQPELAERSGVPYTSLHRYLEVNGGREMPVPVLFAVCDALGVPLETLAVRATQRSE